MRSNQRNWRPFWFANQLSIEPVYDDYGNDTLETRPVYAPPSQMFCNISSNAGQDAVSAFGTQTEYSRTMSFPEPVLCPVKEGSIVWFGVDVTEPHNYVVVRVADSKNGVLVALREVSKQ